MCKILADKAMVFDRHVCPECKRNVEEIRYRTPCLGCVFSFTTKNKKKSEDDLIRTNLDARMATSINSISPECSRVTGSFIILL